MIKRRSSKTQSVKVENPKRVMSKELPKMPLFSPGVLPTSILESPAKKDARTPEKSVRRYLPSAIPVPKQKKKEFSI